MPSPPTAVVQAPVPPAPAPAPPAAAPAPPVVERARILDALRQMLRMLEDPDKLPEVRGPCCVKGRHAAEQQRCTRGK